MSTPILANLFCVNCVGGAGLHMALFSPTGTMQGHVWIQIYSVAEPSLHARGLDKIFPEPCFEQEGGCPVSLALFTVNPRAIEKNPL